MNYDELVKIMEETLEASGDGTVAYVKDFTIERAAIAILKQLKEENTWKRIEHIEGVKRFSKSLNLSIPYLVSDGVRLSDGCYDFRLEKWCSQLKGITHYKEMEPPKR